MPSSSSPRRPPKSPRRRPTGSRARQWTEFEACCLAQPTPLRPLPASAHTLAEYVSHLADRGLPPASLQQAIATIRVRHKRVGRPAEPDTTAALEILRTHRRDRAEAGKGKRAPAVTLGPLRAMTEDCDNSTTAGLRDCVIVVLGFAAMLRRSELSRLEST